MLSHYFQEIESNLKITGLIVDNEMINRIEINSRRGEIIQKASQIVGELCCVGRGGGNEKRFPGCQPEKIPANRSTPFERQIGEREMAGETRDR